MRTKFIFIILFVLLTMLGCGWVEDSQYKKDTVKISSLVSVCDLNIGNLKKIAVQDISADLDCLEASLYVYRNSVKHNDRNYFTKDDMIQFLNIYLETPLTNINVTIIDFLFKLKAVLFGGTEEIMEYEMLPYFSSLMKKVNYHIIKFKEIYADSQDLDIDEQDSVRRKAFISMINNLVRGVREEIAGRQKSGQDFDLKSVVNLAMSLNKVDAAEAINENLRFKPFFLGGDNRYLTQEELNKLLGKLLIVAEPLYEILMSPKINVMKLQYIFRKPVKDELQALHKLLIALFKVKHDPIQSIQRNDFDLFFGQIDELYSVIIDLFYELKVLLLGGNDGSIEADILDDFIDMLQVINKAMVPMNQMIDMLDPYDPVHMAQGKAWIGRTATDLATDLIAIIEKKERPNKAFHIAPFLNIMEDLGYAPLVQAMKTFSLLKPIILGGKQGVISHCEFIELLKKSPEISKIIFDVVFSRVADLNNLKYFFTKPLINESAFLKENLRRFIRIKHWDNQNLEIYDFKTFLSAFGDDPRFTSLLDFFYEAKALFLGGSSEKIEVENLGNFLELVSIFNQEIATFNNTMKKDAELTKEEFFKGKKIIENSAGRLSNDFLDIMNFAIGEGKSLHIDVLLKVFHAYKNPGLAETIKKFFLAKPLVVGGEKYVITFQELKRFLNKFPDIAGALYDVMLVEGRFFDSTWDYISYQASAYWTLVNSIELREGEDKRKVLEDLWKEIDAVSAKRIKRP